jgi:hypothetical protein
LPSFLKQDFREGTRMANCKNEGERTCNGNWFPFMLWVAHSFQSLNRSSTLFYVMGSWGQHRTERDGELSRLFLITSVFLTWMKGRGCRWVFLHHLGLWFVIKQSWEMNQPNHSQVFALCLRVLGSMASSLAVRIKRKEAARSQATHILSTKNLVQARRVLDYSC